MKSCTISFLSFSPSNFFPTNNSIALHTKKKKFEILFEWEYYQFYVILIQKQHPHKLIQWRVKLVGIQPGIITRQYSLLPWFQYYLKEHIWLGLAQVFMYDILHQFPACIPSPTKKNIVWTFFLFFFFNFHIRRPTPLPSFLVIGLIFFYF